MRILANSGLWSVFFACLIPFTLQARDGLSFEANLGQTGADIRYIARTSNGVIFVKDRTISLDGQGSYELLDANLSARWTPEIPSGETVSYFIGRDSSKWVTDAPHYQRLIRHSVYPGIDLVLYGAGEQLEYDFVLAPHADPARIRLKFGGKRGVSIDSDGALSVITQAGELRHRKPVLFETLPDGSRRNVTGGFQILGSDEVGFSVEGHDPALPLSIDPVLQSSTYFGGNGDDQVIATDGNGTLVGMTNSIDVPGAPFLRPAGTSLFLKSGARTVIVGCTGNVTVTSAAFSPSINETIAAGGYADCTDLPTSFGYNLSQAPPFQPNYAGGATDGFLLVAFLQYQTPFNGSFTISYIGGPGDDRVNAVSVDSYSAFAIAGSTTERGLPQPWSNLPSAVENPAGGLDAFVMIGSAGLHAPIFLGSTTYLGGSGDDTALGVAVLGDAAYVTGETKSPDFPLVNAIEQKRQGDSDAFVSLVIGGGTIATSTLFGGSGSDRGVAITILPNSNIALAGVTSSTDLLLKNPTQKAYGGGASDAFLAQFSSDLKGLALLSSTYMGGSGADEATSIAGSYPNTIFVGGWTASNDFPTVNPLQKKFGGGPDDGFLVHFDNDGSIYAATYFGGTGSDRILGVATANVAQFYGSYGPTVWAAGTTTSPNLAVDNPDQAKLNGSSDGFVAEITANIFSVSPFLGGKDLRGAVTIFLGNQPLASSTTVTITSSDPSKVQVAADTVTPGAKSVSAPPSVGAMSFFADCLTDSGSAELTISAPGYASKTIPATCLPSAILVQQQSGATGPVQTNIGVPVTLFFFQVVKNPENGLFLGATAPRPGAAPVTVEIASSHPSVGPLPAPSITFAANYGGNFTFTPVAIGSTNLTFNAGAIPIFPSDTLAVAVGGSYYAPQPFAVPAGFQARIYLPSVNGNQQTKPPTVTSHNPALLALSLDPTKKGTGSITLPAPANQQAIWLQAFGSTGKVQLTISVPGEPTLSTTVQLTTPVAMLSYGTNVGQTLQLAVAGTSTIGVSVASATTLPDRTVAVNPGSAPVTFSLQSSHGNVVTITPASVQLAPSAYASGSFQVTGVAAGSTVLTLTNSAKIPSGGSFPSVPVTVAKKPLTFPDVEVGKNLATMMTISLPAPATSDVVVSATVNDPTLALLSLDGASPGLAQVTTLIPGGRSAAQFVVYGLASSGQAKVTATIAGYGTITANVNLDRSGFYWTEDSFATSPAAPGPFVNVAVGPLDAVSGLPVGTQALGLGITGVLKIANSNSKVATVNPTQLAIPIPAPGFDVTPLSAGSATLTLEQPPGFSTPSVRQKLIVTVAKPVLGLSIYPSMVGKNTQIQIVASGVIGNVPVTFTSSDPSKVLLSSDLNKRGSGSVTVHGTTAYLQALASGGTVSVKASAPGYPSVFSPVTLAPSGFGIVFDVNNPAVTNQNGKYTTTTLSNSVNILVNLYAGSSNQPTSAAFIPGLAPLMANITSSNSAVASITGSPVTIPVTPGQTSYNGLATATLSAAGLGETTISISQPAGYSAIGNNSLTLDVIAPSLIMNNLSAAKDTLTLNGVNLPPGAKPPSAAIPVTVTSSDASRILLSPDATTKPAASITATIPAGSLSTGFYIHALSNNGNVSIKATAAGSGYGNGSSTVALLPLAFGFVNNPSAPVQTRVQAGPQQLQVGAFQVYPGSSVFNPITLRPGVSPITVGLKSSDPKTVSITSAVVFQAGAFNSPSVTYTPLKPGTATLSLVPPAGDATTGTLTIVVIAAAITPEYSTPLVIGRDLQTSVNFFVDSAQPNAQVTVTSSDPSRLVVSTNATTTGQSSVSLPAQGQGLFAQALSGSGTAMLTFTSPGYRSATLTVNLVPSGAVFTNGVSYEQDLLTNAGVQQVSVVLAPLDPLSFQPGAPQTVRPGATLSVAVTSSDSSILSITTSTVQFSPQPDGTSQAAAGIQPNAAGTAIITLGPLAGNPTPASQNQIVYTVSAPVK